MKKPLLLIIATLVFAVGFSQSKWTTTDYAGFIKTCLANSLAGVSADSSKYFCYCMMLKMEQKHPDPADIDKAELNSAEWQKDILLCMGLKWTKEYRDNFINSCIASAKEGLGEEKAASYCECMLFRLQNMYATTEEVDKLSAEDLAKPEFQKMIRSCLY
jgi:hypothetical protein